MILATKDVFKEVGNLNVLPRCLTALVAHYARSSDKKIIKSVLQSLPFLRPTLRGEGLYLDIPLINYYNLMVCPNPSYLQVVTVRFQYETFWREFDAFIEGVHDPAILTPAMNAHEAIFTKYSSLVRLTN